MGTFHFVSAYMKMLGKKMEGTGLADIFQESGLVSGSVNGVMNGKNYDRALHCHKILMEALERLLMQAFLQWKGDQGNEPIFSENTTSRMKFSKDHIKTDTQELRECEEIKQFLLEYELYRDGILRGEHGKTQKL